MNYSKLPPFPDSVAAQDAPQPEDFEKPDPSALILETILIALGIAVALACLLMAFLLASSSGYGVLPM